MTYNRDNCQFHAITWPRHDFCNYYNRYIHDTRVWCITHKPKGGESNA